MAEILKNLLPHDMVQIFLERGEEKLPMTCYRESRAVVLHLDLRNFTVLTDTLDTGELARHIDAIFKSFDALVCGKGCKALGLFKIDTIGDAYEAAAWLCDPQQRGDAQQRDAQGHATAGNASSSSSVDGRQHDANVCACVVNVAWAMIDAVKAYSAQHDTKIECRIGVSSGQVLAGMLGKLQPRYHLMGEAVWRAHKLESFADINTVNVGEDVQALLSDFLPTLIHVQRQKREEREKREELNGNKNSLGQLAVEKREHLAVENRGQLAVSEPFNPNTEEREGVE